MEKKRDQVWDFPLLISGFASLFFPTYHVVSVSITCLAGNRASSFRHFFWISHFWFFFLEGRIVELVLDKAWKPVSGSEGILFVHGINHTLEDTLKRLELSPSSPLNPSLHHCNESLFSGCFADRTSVFQGRNSKARVVINQPSLFQINWNHVDTKDPKELVSAILFGCFSPPSSFLLIFAFLGWAQKCDFVIFFSHRWITPNSPLPLQIWSISCFGSFPKLY